MSIKRTTITNEGVAFMKSIANKNGATGLIGGTKSYVIPYSSETTPVLHSANALDKDGKSITTNLQLINSLIFWINNYSKQYDLDPNIISAQCFMESGYQMWTYSTEAYGLSQFTIPTYGLSQFTIPTYYDIVINNGKGKFTQIEVEKIVKDLSDVGVCGKYKKSSIFYTEKDNAIDKQTSINNRVQLYQNIIDNPEIMIKAQCVLMDEISNRNDDYASSSLFAYNVGSMLHGTTYYDIVNKQIKNSGISSSEKIYEFE